MNRNFANRLPWTFFEPNRRGSCRKSGIRPIHFLRSHLKRAPPWRAWMCASDRRRRSFTVALVAKGNPLDRVLRAAPMFDRLERSMSELGERPTRLDLGVYKDHVQSGAGPGNAQTRFCPAQSPSIPPGRRPRSRNPAAGQHPAD